MIAGCAGWMNGVLKQCIGIAGSQHAFRPLQELAVKWLTASTWTLTNTVV